MIAKTVISRLIAESALGYLPVRVKTGPARGAKWTLAPFSSNWRHGGEQDLAAGLKLLPQVKGMVCWDFGAHFGIHTVGMAMQTGPEGEVASFEPDPVAFTRLSYHLRRNNLGNVKLFQNAASDSASAKEMIIYQRLGSSCSHFQYEDEKVGSETKTIKVATIVPDELVRDGIIRLPNLIKVDVQGHGAKALCGSIRSIKENKPIVVFSNHSRWELADTRAILEPLGYGVRNLEGGAVDWRWFDSNESAILIAG